MTKTQLEKFIMMNCNIDFNYNGKRYGIERMTDDTNVYRIFFWEWNNDTTSDNSYVDYIDFELNAKIDGKPLIDILQDIDDVEIF